MSEKDRVHRLSRALLVLAMLAVVGQLVGLYQTTGPPQPSWFPAFDKVEHAVGFAMPVFFLLAFRSRRAVEHHRVGTPSPTPASQRRFVVMVLAVFALHAVVSELIQHFFYRYRTGDPFDVVADVVGVTVGWLLARLLWRSSNGGQPGAAGSSSALQQAQGTGQAQGTERSGSGRAERWGSDRGES